MYMFVDLQVAIAVAWQWRGSKLIDKSCRNHGTCPWCQRNRNRQKRITKIRINELLKDYENGR